MDYQLAVQDASTDAEQMEALYRLARKKRQESEFVTAVQAHYQEAPANLLLAAWHFRLARAPQEAAGEGVSDWLLAALMGAAAGLALFALSGDAVRVLYHRTAALNLFWAPVTVVFILAFLVIASRENVRRAVGVFVGLAAVCAAVLLLGPTLAIYMQTHYLTLAATHLPVLAWAGVGVYLLGLRASDQNRFAFLSKSVEAVVSGGLFLVGGSALGGITVGLFSTLNIFFSDWLIRLLVTGGAGLIALLAVATVYDPHSAPARQDFSSGLSRTIAILMRLLLPLSLVVLAAYIVVIPFRFLEPFQNRDVLIVYNLMLFAIMGLLVGIAPVSVESLSPRMARLLRTGLLALAVMATLVSLYALSATVYRTVQGGFTMNRTVIIGWNVINIGLLIALVVGMLTAGRERWLEALHAVTRPAAIAYTAWALFALLVTPLIFQG